MSDETRVDREAWTRHVSTRCPNMRAHASGTIGPYPCPDCYAIESFWRRIPWEKYSETPVTADAVLALLPAPHPQGGAEALRAVAETWRDRLLASTTFWVDDLAAHDVVRQLTNLLDSENCPHLAESGDEGPVVDLPGGWPVRWRCDGCDRVRYDDAALADLRALLAAAPAPTEGGRE